MGLDAAFTTLWNYIICLYGMHFFAIKLSQYRLKNPVFQFLIVKFTFEIYILSSPHWINIYIYIHVYAYIHACIHAPVSSAAAVLFCPPQTGSLGQQ